MIAAIEALRSLIPALSRYLDSGIQPVLTMFAAACRGELLMPSYDATSVGENANQMLKNVLPPQIHILIEIREA
jgi:hypothetical protein